MKQKRIVEYILVGFKTTVWIKAMDGVLELISRVLLLVYKKRLADFFLLKILRPELLEEPNNVIANFFTRFANSVSQDSNLFIAIYILTHGLVNTILAFALLKDKKWAFPTSIAVLSIFTLILLYRIVFAFNPSLLLLIVLNFITVFLIWKEYQIEKGDAPTRA